MSEQPSTVREALLAELLGDIQVALTRLDQVDQSARATADAINRANELYRQQINAMVEKLRTETASIVLKTTEHAANSLVGQQQATLQTAATRAIQKALTPEILRRGRRDWLMAAVLGACSGSAATAILSGIMFALSRAEQ